eukprot:5588875-Lingulodinium_polyedra.AAC.1
MAWHSSSWPGMLALFASEDVAVQRRALQELEQDWRAFERARSLAPASPFLLKLVRKSCFSTTVMSEVAEACFSGAEKPEVEVLRDMQGLSRSIFTGWGQTKVVEDAFNRMRDRESRD